MKRILGNLFWIILAAPFYVVILICCAYSLIVLKGVGIIFKETEPYKPIDKLDSRLYNIAKEYLIQ